MILSAQPQGTSGASPQEVGGVAFLGWGMLKASIVFFAGGILLSFIADFLVFAILLAADASGYPSALSNQLRQLVNYLSFSPYFIWVLVFYAKGQLINAFCALLSFVVLKRVSFWLMIAAVPVVAFGFTFSFAVDLLLPPNHSESSALRFFSMTVFQSLISLGCLMLMRLTRITQLPSSERTA